MYYIYHIPGVKIGVSHQIEKRMAKQGFTNWEILEEHTDIYEVSKREKELQKEYGYPVDKSHYYQMIEKASKGGNIGGYAKALLTKEQKEEVLRKFVPYKYSQRTLAKEYGVSKGVIQRIIDSALA